MRTIGFMIRKEFQQTFRDRKMIAMMFVAPVMQLLILGYAANLDVTDIPIAVYDQDKTETSRNLIDGFLNSGYFRLERYASTMGELDARIMDGKASAGLVIPRGFGRAVESAGSPKLQYLVDGSESNAAMIGLNYATLVVNRFSSAQARGALERLGPKALALFEGSSVDAKVRIWYNPNLKSRNFMVPGVLALVLTVITILLTSLSIVKEKELGTLEQLIVTPITPVELVVGKLVPFAVISLVIVTLVLVSSWLLFGLWVKGSILTLYVLSVLYLLTTLGLGLFVSTMARTQQQAMMITVFFFVFPMIMLSGFVFPIENMPLPIQLVTYFLPLRYFFVIVRGLFLKGVGLAELWKEAAALFVFGVGIIGVSILRFRKRLE
jgi:ABC-2 type transport system permease protein